MKTTQEDAPTVW